LPMRNDILRILAQEKALDTFCTTMIDLYAIHSDFPGLDEAEKLRHLPRQRVEKLEESFGADIGDRRFIPNIQLHEFEAILFANPAAFESYYTDRGNEIAELEAIAMNHESAEDIDDGPQTSPSKRIIDCLPDYEGAKPTAGPQIAEMIGIDVIRRSCPHFNSWLTTLETLGERE
jgi:Domain of unknown function (DUF4276)